MYLIKSISAVANYNSSSCFDKNANSFSFICLFLDEVNLCSPDDSGLDADCVSDDQGNLKGFLGDSQGNLKCFLGDDSKYQSKSGEDNEDQRRKQVFIRGDLN